MALSRRKFLARTAVTALGALGSHPLLGLSRRGWSAGSQNVVIAGAGMAGLCAAYELNQRGYQVIVLEASPQFIGGRVRTYRFGDGRYGELGAMRIPATHAVTRHYISELLNLGDGPGQQPLRQFVSINPRGIYYAHNSRTRVGALTPAQDVQHIATFATGFWTQSFGEIPGGMDLLPQAFVAKLRARGVQIRLGARVLRIGQNDQQAFVAYQDGAGQSHVASDHLICTLPFPILRSIPIEHISDRKKAAIAGLKYENANKVLLATRERFWESDDGIYGGASYSDQLSSNTYYPSDNALAKDPAVSHRPGVLLASYSLAAKARALEALPSDQARIQEVLKDVELMHPRLGEAGMIQQALNWTWDQQPLFKGAFAAHGQQNTDFYRQAILPEGRIHFAGEHLSEDPTWIQGALNSALRCVREIEQS